MTSGVTKSKEKIIEAILGTLDMAYGTQSAPYLTIKLALLKLTHRELSDYLILCYDSRKSAAKTTYRLMEHLRT